jgi:hypothetical protein
VLYANNYQPVDDENPVMQEFHTPDEALAVFRDGAVMSKGTTTSTGLVNSFYANIFGPPMYPDLHERLAVEFFKAFFEQGVLVGELRTQLGINGMEQSGPELSARVLLNEIVKRAHLKAAIAT